jgi:hypothetical protein
MRRRRIRRWLPALLLALALAASWAPAAREAENPDKPETPAERIAGRWRITLKGLSTDHEEIVASLAVDGELLLGTFMVGRRTIPLSSGTLIGTDFKISFRHVFGETMWLKGRLGPRGLQGRWEAGGEKGTFTARRQA